MDWFDPEIWKVPAALAEHWQKIAGAIVVIGGALGTLLRWGLAPIRWLVAKSRRAPPAREFSPPDDRPLRFVDRSGHKRAGVIKQEPRWLGTGT
jgi:hypothetical protein